MYGLQTYIFLFCFVLFCFLSFCCWVCFASLTICFCSQLCLACHKAGYPQMHEMIKMSITKLLTALCLRVFPGHQGPVAFHKVFDLVL